MKSDAAPVQAKPIRSRQTALAVSSSNDIALALTTEQADLLTRAKAYWYFAEWALIEQLIDTEHLKLHPEKGFLNLLLGTALVQLGSTDRAKSCIQLALKLNVSRDVVTRMLLSGARHSLANITLLKDQPVLAEQHYTVALQLAGAREVPVAATSRKLRAYSNFGLYTQAVDEIDQSLKTNQDLTRSNVALLLAQIKNEQNRLKRILNGLTESASPQAQRDDTISLADSIVNQCFGSEQIVEVMESINNVLVDEKYGAGVKFSVCYLLVLRFIELKDNVMAVHYLNHALSWQDSTGDVNKLEQLSKLALELGQAELCVDLLVQAKAANNVLTEVERTRLLDGYKRIRAASQQKQQHGHDLILAYLQQHKNLWAVEGRKRLLIEVGTTREHVPGQGSTMQIAEFCQEAGIDFITVDMDPNNGLLANAAFKRHQLPFNAVTQKGEVFFAEFNESIDFVFLDAYDFDHGKHSALRQSRYLKYLGETIDEQQCHKMHLDCAVALKDKLSLDGIICIDDTWLDDNDNWTAKGTTAVPYLLQNGFEIVEARNRAVLLKRVHQ